MKVEREKGAAMVEFAIVATLLMTVLIGIIEFGVVFFVQGSLAGAAREAARDFAITGVQTSARNAALASVPGGPPINLTAGEVTFNMATCPVGQNVTVIITHTHTMLTGFFGSSIQLNSTGSMRCKG